MAIVDVLLPQWGMGMSEGTITTWLKGVGDTVNEDDPLAEIEAEKAAFPESGVFCDTLLNSLNHSQKVTP